MEKADKKLLTSFLGECWHDYNPVNNSCDKCHRTGVFLNRTFTTWQDFGDCFNRLVELESLEKLVRYTDARCPYTDFDPIRNRPVIYIFKWLHGKNSDGTYRLCSLIAEALKEGVI